VVFSAHIRGSFHGDKKLAAAVYVSEQATQAQLHGCAVVKGTLKSASWA
jgi:hypothetical protein